jgi:methylmalonyl-CoA mutase
VEGTDPEPLAAGFPPVDQDAWLGAVDKVLKGKPFETLVSRTDDGITVAPLYTRDASPGAADDAGFPGAEPYTRGAHAAPRPHGLWDVRSVVDHPDPTEANRRALQDLERGVTSLTVVLDGARTDLSARLEGVYLDLAPVVLRAGAGFVDAAAQLEALWSERGVGPTAAAGGFGADPLGTMAAHGVGAVGIDEQLAALGDLAARTAVRYPGVRAVSVDTLAAVEAGASEAQELAVMLSTGAAYLRAMAAAGLDADAACGQIEVTLGADADVFATLAKVRAARRLWAAMASACGASEPARAMRLHVRTARRMLTERDPWVNLLRVTAAVFAAGVAGADSVTAEPYDALLGDPGELGRRMARNTQLLLLEESNLGRVLDPAGGSGYVESLTDELAGVAWARFQELEEAGGFPAVLVDGSLAARITTVRDDRLREVATRRRPITGVSEFPNLAEDAPAAGNARGARPAGVPLLTPVRWARDFEALRDAADAHAGATGSRPQVFLVNLGPVAVHTARATFAKNLFEAGGIEAVSSERGTGTGFATAADAAADAAAAGARIACLCSSDDLYAERAVEAAAALKAAGVERLYLAGKPGDRREAEEAAGVDEFVHLGVDVLDVLRRAHGVLGVGQEVAS